MNVKGKKTVLNYDPTSVHAFSRVIPFFGFFCFGASTLPVTVAARVVSKHIRRNGKLAFEVTHKSNHGTVNMVYFEKWQIFSPVSPFLFFPVTSNVCRTTQRESTINFENK